MDRGRAPASGPVALVNDMISILVDRDATLALLSPGEKGSGIVAKFATPIKLYRVIDGKELHDIELQSRRVRGGFFATPRERQHGASWGSDRGAVVSWGRMWSGRRGLGKDLYLLELDAQGKTFFHIAPKISPAFDPFGPAHQHARMNASECETGLGCSVVDVHRKEVTVHRVGKEGKTTLLDDPRVRSHAEKKSPKSPIQISTISSVMSSGWIHGVPVAVYKNQEQVQEKAWHGGVVWREGPLYGTWEVEMSTRQGEETTLTRGKKTRKAAIDEAEEILRGLYSQGRPQW